MSLSAYLILGTLLFMIGAFGALTRRNAIAVLMSIELMINAASINFLAFWRFLRPTTQAMVSAGTPSPAALQSMEPQVFVLVGLTVAAAEAAVGLAIVLHMY